MKTPRWRQFRRPACQHDDLVPFVKEQAQQFRADSGRTARQQYLSTA